ncbi:MAG: biotin/lipoyl-containing protein, partial [Desulfuromonas sp.]
SLNRKNFCMERRKLKWLRNPLLIIAETYEYLNMTMRPDAPASDVIWSHDHEHLQKAISFYTGLREHFPGDLDDFETLNTLLENEKPQGNFSAAEWDAIRAAHIGFEAGNELLGLLYMVGVKTNFFDFKVEENLDVTIPEYLHDSVLQAQMKKVLVPPPATKEDEIVTPGGGMYYAQEAPGMPPFIKEGEHFEKGQPLFILEVMKMFNKIPAPFSGTVDKILIDRGDGVIVSKGQPIFKVTPDERFVEVDHQAVEKERRNTTEAYLQAIT